MASLDDAILGQLVQLQVAEGFPRADHGDICGEQRLHQHKSQPAAAAKGNGTTYLFLAPPCPGCHHQTCKETGCLSSLRISPEQHHMGTFRCVPCWALLLSPTHPCTPFLGGLLLNCRVCLCLNLGGPFRGVAGPPVTLVADLSSGLWGSKLMAVAELAARPASRLSL